MITQAIIEQVKSRYPSLKASTITSKYNEYVFQVYVEYVQTITMRKAMRTRIDGLYQFDLVKVSNALGTANIKTETGRKSIRWSKIFETTYALFHTVRTGNQYTKQLSHVKLHNDAYNAFITLIEEKQTTMSLPGLEKYKESIAESKAYYKDTTIKWVRTPIDMKSITAYIEHQSLILGTGRIKRKSGTIYLSDKLRRKVNDEMFYAMLIKEVAEENGGFLPQDMQQSNSGRIYYKGLNLQNCPKSVRTAAIGKCYQYDMNACAYAMLLNHTRQILMTEHGFTQAEVDHEFSAVKSYITNRNETRKLLVKDINEVIKAENAKGLNNYELYNVTIEQVKAVFTSIGFGSRAVNACWGEEDGTFSKTAIRKTLVSKEATNAFLKHYVVKRFLAQVEMMRDIIYNYHKELGINFEIVDGLPYKGTPTKAQALAHLYQGMEYLALEALTDIIGNENIYVLVHDGFIMKKTIKQGTQHEICKALDNPYLSFTKDSFNAYTSKKRTEHDRLMMEHQQRIVEQEQKAQLMYG